MKKLQFVFIVFLLLPFTGCKSVVQDTVVEPVVVVEKKKEGFLYGRFVKICNVDGMKMVMSKRI